MKRKKYFTDFLFSTPSFLIGAGSVLNLEGNYYSFNLTNDPAQADLLALANDFGCVGQDVQSIIEKLEKTEL